MLVAIQSINLSVLQVKGRSDLFLKLGLIQKATGFIAISIALLLRLGIMGLLWAMVIDSIMAYFINAFYSKRFLGYSIPEQLKDLRPIFLIAVVMAGLTYSLSYLLTINDILMVLIQVVFGVSVYILLSWIFKIEELKTIYQILQPIQKKIFKKVAPSR
ncbi:polysaccharide biosynthesis C-terminal domain-containing protein [Jeotgalibaca sp. MA1X17-3]|uniref:polysaccharide biosynthesis C-terminal domain-containing protein n=1 Tax=Jeotgalibaca sp. MA1X17-3 TaxID=2908211 RepID=UPI001F2E5E52|nr:polysaccharide biosynthesis C-terminal domain-containing protein [Jeotgalibaca sp. MA1X17-3]UJF15384.1 polysaccharide biosynthesis C-terminal domain-containing protein [Jeotgalibaca sp. MA1X17-3]